jgi:hypothetical protein
MKKTPETAQRGQTPALCVAGRAPALDLWRKYGLISNHREGERRLQAFSGRVKNEVAPIFQPGNGKSR